MCRTASQLAFLLLFGLSPVVAQAQGEVRVQQVYGSAEGQQAGLWRPLRPGALQVPQIRTGAGRVELGWGGGTVLLNSAGQVRVNSSNGKLQMVAGQAYVTGPVQLYVQGYHLNVAAGSAARVDLLARTERIAVLRGTARLAYGSRTVNIAAGQQFSLARGSVSAYQESDPWYLSRITGRGDAVIEALRGQVTVSQPGSQGQFRVGGVGQSLGEGQRLRTGRNSWAELGFTGGGYLRLQADSELQVTAVQTSTRGREVWLQLNRGSAWNVVARGQGGYRLSTPVISTAVRGTVFRVDADGLVKVFEGEVEAGEAAVQLGQQLEANRVEPLQPDAQDALNLSLDQLRALPVGLRDLTAQSGGMLTVQAAPLSELWLEARAEDGVLWAWPLPPQGEVTLDSEGRPLSLEPVTYALSPVGRQQVAALPAGKYSFRVAARRYDQRAELSPAPAFSDLPASGLPDSGVQGAPGVQGSSD
ncbi:MAG: FecR family protein [Deinococcus sp.]|nr:FecR family protein [Deinococcus sp.]